MAEAEDIVTKYFREHPAKPLQPAPADPCADAQFYKDCHATMSGVSHSAARGLPPPLHYEYLLIAIVLFVGAAAWYHRAPVRIWLRRWLLEPLTRKGARSAGRFKAWWLED